MQVPYLVEGLINPLFSLCPPALLEDPNAVYELIHMNNSHGPALATALTDRLTEVPRRLREVKPHKHRDELLSLSAEEKAHVLRALDGWLSDAAVTDVQLVKDHVLKVFRVSKALGEVLIKVCTCLLEGVINGDTIR